MNGMTGSAGGWLVSGPGPEVIAAAVLGDSAGEQAYAVTFTRAGKPGACIAAWFHPWLRREDDTYGVGACYQYRAGGPGRWGYSGHDTDPADELFTTLQQADDAARDWARLAVEVPGLLRDWSFLAWDGEPPVNRPLPSPGGAGRGAEVAPNASIRAHPRACARGKRFVKPQSRLFREPGTTKEGAGPR